MLQDLRLLGTLVGDRGATAIANSLMHGNHSLRKLDLWDSQIRAGVASSLARACRFCELEQLLLGRNDLGDEGIRAFASEIGKGEPTLTSLDISDCQISDESATCIISLCSSVKPLRIMSLAKNFLKTEACLSIVKAAADTNINVLDLSDNLLLKKHAKKLSRRYLTSHRCVSFVQCQMS